MHQPHSKIASTPTGRFSHGYGETVQAILHCAKSNCVLLCVQVFSTCLFVTEADELFSQWSELFVGWFGVKLIFADTCSSGSSVPSDSAKYFGRLRLRTPLPKQQLRKNFSHRKNLTLIEKILRAWGRD